MRSLSSFMTVCLTALVFSGCASAPTSPSVDVKHWSAPSLPTDLSPVPVFLRFGHAPRYPFEARSAGRRGEVLFELIIDNERISRWSVIRSSARSFEESAIAAITSLDVALGVPNGTYCFSVIYCDPSEVDQTRPGSFWVTTDLNDL